MVQGIPKPRNTLTLLDPVMFPIAASAYGSLMAANLDANVSGMEVPSATNVIAVTDFYNPTTQPNMPAKSPTMAVCNPTKIKLTTKVPHPPQ